MATHLATSLVLLAFFFKDWVRIIKGMFSGERLGWLLVVATIPAGLLGLLLEHKLKLLFASPLIVAGMLILNAALLYAAELLRARGTADMNTNEHSDVAISGLSWGASLKIGFAQALALIPGFSRTGATLGGGLLVGLNHKDAARFSFLLATPIIFAAAVLKIPTFIKTGGTQELGVTFAGVIASAIFAYLSVKFLTKYFETQTLKPFASYCAVAGALAFIFLLVR